MTERIPFRARLSNDAWATVRGFVYQVELTILRWLDLAPSQYLELECGEDIDLVAQAFADDAGDGSSRKLEQVKVRSEPLTLRCEAAVQTLVNAVCHLTENPQIALRFCYTTNAKASRERPCPFPAGIAGIELWEQLRQDLLPNDKRDEAAKSLQQFLTLSPKPDAVQDAAWTAFQEFLRNADESEFVGFVRRFEWSSGVAEPESIAEAVSERLRHLNAADENHAGELYRRLFLVVIRRLTQKGRKRLTQAELVAQFACPTLSETDHALLRRLDNYLELISQRVDVVASAVTALGQRVDELAHEGGFRATKLEAVGLIDLGVPPLAKHCSERTTTVADLLVALSDKCWLAVFGTTATGKTHLASLMARQRGGCRGWVRFHHSMPSDQASTLLHEALLKLSNTASLASGPNPYQAVCQRLGPEACLVLDDLPHLDSGDLLTARLVSLAIACHGVGVRIISTSQYRLPNRLCEVLGEQRLQERRVPPFSEAEARDVFTAYGAPPNVTTAATVRFVNGLASGHPLLLTLAVRYLRDRQWELDDRGLDELLRGAHVAELSDELLRRIYGTLQLSERELLYRLSLAIAPVSESLALRLAAVDRPVSQPKECLSRLIGTWVQRDVHQTLVISPLLKNVGSDNLSPNTQMSCHILLGEEIGHRIMSPWEAEIAITHFVRGRDFDRAGLLLLVVLSKLYRAKQPVDPGLLLSFWNDLPFPEEMSLGMQLNIRMMQFLTFPKYSRGDAFVLDDLDRLVGLARPEHAADVWLVGLTASLFLSPRDVSCATRFFRRAVMLVREAKVKPRQLRLPRGKNYAEHLWVLIVHIQTESQLREWLEAFESMNSKERQLVINSPDARLGCVVLADRLMLVESDKPSDERRWECVLEASNRLQQWARDRGWSYLAACAFKAELNIWGEFLKKAESCEVKVRRFVAANASQPELQSLVAGMFGRMLAMAGKHREANPWFSLAFQADIGLPVDRMMTLLAAAMSYSQDDRETALQCAQQAAELVRTDDAIPDAEAVKAFGELAVAQFYRYGGREGARRAFPTWAEAGERLFGARNRGPVWKDLVVVFGHTHNFLAQMAMFGQAPDRACDGSQYAAPRQGMFFTSHPDRINYFREDTIPSLMWIMSQYARSAGDEVAAAEWLRRAVDEIATKPSSFHQATIQRDMVPSLLLADRFEEAIEAGIRGSQSMVAAKEIASRQTEAISPDTRLEDMVAQLSSEGRRLVDRFAVISAVVPALLRIGSQSLTDRPVANAHANRVACLCRQIALDASDPVFWNGAAAVFDTISASANVREILRVSNSFSNGEYRELRVLGYLAASLAEEPEATFQAQLASLPTFFSWYPPGDHTHSRLLIPFIEAYWVRAIRTTRFKLRSPDQVEAQLERALATEPACRVKAVLRAVRPAFRLESPGEMLTWLNQD
jgi:hypothetical protein